MQKKMLFINKLNDLHDTITVATPASEDQLSPAFIDGTSESCLFGQISRAAGSPKVMQRAIFLNTLLKCVCQNPAESNK